MTTKKLRPYLVRLAIVLGISLVFALIFNEVSYLLLKDDGDRAPETIQLVIPEGTAQDIESGEQTLEIPVEMTFVIGDVLEVVNQDEVPHQLGPVWVPPGAMGSLVMEQAGKFAYSCSFQSTQYLGLDVRPPTTISTRVTALALTVPTLASLIYIYSLLIVPVKPAVPATAG
jgi:hypothetical protein